MTYLEYMDLEINASVEYIHRMFWKRYREIAREAKEEFLELGGLEE